MLRMKIADLKLSRANPGCTLLLIFFDINDFQGKPSGLIHVGKILSKASFLSSKFSLAMYLCGLFVDYFAKQVDRSTNLMTGFIYLSLKFEASFRQNFTLSFSCLKLGDTGPWDIKLLHLLTL